MDNLTGILAFVRTAEHLSFVAAGRVLGISASAVGKSVAKLEQQLGVRLLHRTTRRVSLTEEGNLFYDRCSRILDDLDAAEALVTQAAGAPRGRLRVGLPTIGYRFLQPVLPEFRRRFPDIELDLDFNDRLVDLIEDGLDAVIRSGVLTVSSLMSRRLGRFRFVLCAAPGYIAAHGVPETPADLVHHACLRFRFPTTGKPQTWSFGKAWRTDPIQGPSPLTCNNMEALRAAAIAGTGIAYMPDFLARDALENGSLRTVLDAFPGEPGQFSVLWPSSRQMPPRLRVFVDYLGETLFPDP